MYVHTEKNITLNISHIDPNYVESMGETYMTIRTEFCARLLRECCGFVEFFPENNDHELWAECDEDSDILAEHYDKQDSTIEVSNADAIIAIYEFCLDNDDETFCFDVETENTTWPIHDLEHAKFDAAGCTVYVDKDVEKQRILTSFAVVAENCPENLPDYEFCEKLEDGFKARFKETLDLYDYKYFEGE